MFPFKHPLDICNARGTLRWSSLKTPEARPDAKLIQDGLSDLGGMFYKLVTGLQVVGPFDHHLPSVVLIEPPLHMFICMRQSFTLRAHHTPPVPRTPHTHQRLGPGLRYLLCTMYTQCTHAQSSEHGLVFPNPIC